MNARDGLHAPAIAVRQAHAVNAFGTPDVGRAKAGDRNGLIGRQAAGHARHPQHLVADVLHGAVGELVDLRELFERGLHVLMRTGDQLDLRFAEVSGNAGMRQGRTQGCRMRCQRQAAAGLGAQAFFSMPRRMPWSWAGVSAFRRSCNVVISLFPQILELAWKLSQAGASRWPKACQHSLLESARAGQHAGDI